MQSGPAAPAGLPRVQQQSLLHMLVSTFVQQMIQEKEQGSQSQAAFGSALSSLRTLL
jgi:hypothetical protein